MTDNDIINKLWPNKQPLLKRLINKLDVEYINYLTNRFSNCVDLDEALFRIKYNIEHRPNCPICGKEITFNNKLNCFNKFCSKECANKNPELIKHRKETFVKKYGIDVPQKLECFKLKEKQTWSEKSEEEKLDIISKRKRTKLERYDDENYVNVEKFKETWSEKTDKEKLNIISKRKQTKLDRYGDENYVNTEKSKDTCLTYYGVPYFSQTSYFNEKTKKTWSDKTSKEISYIVSKSKQTKLERYGDENYVNIDKIYNTTYYNYGVYSSLSLYRDTEKCHSKEARIKSVNTVIDKFGKENYCNRKKYKETCKDKYGVEYYSQTDIYKINQSNIMKSEYMQQKRYNTMKKNNSFNISKDEELCYELLKKVYINIIRQYKSDVYPFNCDFYIPDIDLYIEYNGSWTHGFHPFDSNLKEDVKRAKKLKESVSKYNNNAYYTWTDLDIRKRNIAKENKLNYIEFWNIDEVNDYINNILKLN